MQENDKLNLFTPTGKLTDKLKLNYDALMYFNKYEISNITSNKMLEIIKELKPDEYIMSKWFSKFLHFIFKTYSVNGENVVIDYILENYTTIFEKPFTHKYFMRDSFEFGTKELFLRAFDSIIDNTKSTYPFVWYDIAAREALTYDAWWGINKIWDRQDKTDWHPLDYVKDEINYLLVAADTYSKTQNKSNGIEEFINKARVNIPILDYASKQIIYDQRWEFYIPDTAKDIFLF